MNDAAPLSVLIIGASRGIGLGLTKAYLKRGWSVTATARDPSKAADLTALAETSATSLTIETVDTVDATSCEALRDRLRGVCFDALIVNAGVSGPAAKTTRTVTDAEFDSLFITNALAPVRLAELLVKNVRADTGVIGMMTSQLGSVEGAAAGGMELYRASKAALNSFTRSFAARHRDLGLVVLSLHPGWVRTDMGGPNADIDIDTSVAGLIDVIDQARVERRDGFYNYKGETLPW